MSDRIDPTVKKILYRSTWTSEKLRDTREQFGISQREIAEILGTSKSVISGIELGRNIYGPTFMMYGIVLERYIAYTNGYLPAFRKAGTSDYMVMEV